MSDRAHNSLGNFGSISVIVPTFRRVAELARCLAALEAQTRLPDEIVVAVRDSDEQTLGFLHRGQSLPPGIRVAMVITPGVVAAMNAGLAAALGDLIALTDDDAAPRTDWLARIETHFAADPGLGGVGGRDWVYHGQVLDDGSAPDAGRISWFGRVAAGHHHAAGPPREVSVLKGVNCAYRATPLRQIGFDKRMAGGGAQVHWELALGLAMRRAGWKLLLDPAIAVDHYPAPRFDEDQRQSFSGIAQRDAVANETLVLFEHLRGLSRVAFLVWAAMVGTGSAPGLLQILRLMIKRRPHALGLWWATVRGRMAGLKAFRETRPGRPGERPGPDVVASSSSGVHS